MEWYETIFEFIDMRSFSNLWFWIALAVLWSTTSHWVLGVPFDLVMRARRHGGQAQLDVDALARINAGRMLFIIGRSGMWLAGLVAMVLTALLITGFGYGVEFAQAVACLACPMALVGLLSLRAAARVVREALTGEDLHRLLMRHRMATQGIGMVAIFVTAMWGMYQNLSIGVL